MCAKPHPQFYNSENKIFSQMERKLSSKHTLVENDERVGGDKEGKELRL